MQSLRPIGLLTADPPRGPSVGGGPEVTAARSGAAGPACDGSPAQEATSVDDSVPDAVARELRTLFDGHLADCRGLDPVFARDIAETVVDFTCRGGRRIRPRLLWWSMRACGGGTGAQVRAALRTAAALELLQTCALIHDDVMDDAAVRRGGPAVHVAIAGRYGEAVSHRAAERLGASAAVLAGDLALAWADDAVATLAFDSLLPPATARRLNGVWRLLRAEMAAGQYLDVHSQATAEHTVTRAARAACLKSALYTVERPLHLGAVLAGADDATVSTLRRAGRCAGLAFQLRDDLDDVFADPAATGKPSGGDLRQGKSTYLATVTRALATAADDRSVLRLLDQAQGPDDASEATLARVREVMTATGARALVEEKVRRLAAQGRRALAGADLAPHAAQQLDLLLGRFTDVPGHEQDRPATARTEHTR